ncbi:MAG: hypothetical protein ACI4PL_01075, partial [Faecousia sp.]
MTDHAGTFALHAHRPSPFLYITAANRKREDKTGIKRHIFCSYSFPQLCDKLLFVEYMLSLRASAHT